MGNLFYRGVQPSEIKKMEYWEMQYWDKWHRIMEKQQYKELERLNK